MSDGFAPPTDVLPVLEQWQTPGRNYFPKTEGAGALGARVANFDVQPWGIPKRMWPTREGDVWSAAVGPLCI